jgi:hypothetical protein
MSKSVQNSIYIKLQKIGILNNEGRMKPRFMKFKAHGLMDLNVDKLSASMIAVAHNGVLNGDVMADPDVEIRVHREKEEVEALSFQNDYLGIYQQVYPDGSNKPNIKLQNEINIFLDEWLSNIIDCMYVLSETED